MHTNLFWKESDDGYMNKSSLIFIKSTKYKCTFIMHSNKCFSLCLFWAHNSPCFIFVQTFIGTHQFCFEKNQRLIIWMNFYSSSSRVQIYICNTSTQMFFSLLGIAYIILYIHTNINWCKPILFWKESDAGYINESSLIFIKSKNAHF